MTKMNWIDQSGFIDKTPKDNKMKIISVECGPTNDNLSRTGIIDKKNKENKNEVKNS